MRYEPRHLQPLPVDPDLPEDEQVPIFAGDPEKDIDPYVFNDDILIALDVALATDRPLLVSGKPGSGKSRLADAVAGMQGWNLLAKSITSRTRVDELTVEVDQLRRLNDAQSKQHDKKLKPDAYYYNPGIFWWAFHPDSARFRGMNQAAAEEHEVRLNYPGIRWETKTWKHPAVLLIDEIDKAQPDLPNDLLEPLDRRRFELPHGEAVHLADDLRLLTLITTNSERELPQAFQRRCVMLELDEPDESRLMQIARRHFPKGNSRRMEQIAKRMLAYRDEAEKKRRRPPGTSEFLDAINACEDLGIDVDDAQDSVWSKIESAILIKLTE